MSLNFNGGLAKLGLCIHLLVYKTVAMMLMVWLFTPITRTSVIIELYKSFILAGKGLKLESDLFMAWKISLMRIYEQLFVYFSY